MLICLVQKFSKSQIQLIRLGQEDEIFIYKLRDNAGYLVSYDILFLFQSWKVNDI